MGKFKADPTDPVASAKGWTRRQQRAAELTRLSKELEEEREINRGNKEWINQLERDKKQRGGWVKDATARADKAEAKIVELEKDRAMLDWLDDYPEIIPYAAIVGATVREVVNLHMSRTAINDAKGGE